MKKKIFFSFVYLAVIVNDDYLEIPEIEELDKVFQKKHIHDITFFVKNNDKWKAWLFEHISKVLVFVNIMKSSLHNYEKHKLPSHTKLFPDFDQINDNLVKEIKEIGKTINIPIHEIDSQIAKANALNKKTNRVLTRFFKGYYDFTQKKEKANNL